MRTSFMLLSVHQKKGSTLTLRLNMILVLFLIVPLLLSGNSIAGDLDERCKKGDLKACESGCEKGNPQFCLYLATLYSKGKREIDKINALVYYGKACEGDIAEACVVAGMILVQGDGVPQDIQTGMSLLKRGCLEGVGIACASLGEYFEMKIKGAEKNNLLPKSKIKEGYEVANKYFRMACKLGDANSCKRLEGSKSKAVCVDLKSCKKACRKGLPKGCLTLGKMYEMGEVTQQNIPMAIVSYEESCGRSVSEACFRLGVLYGNSETNKEQNKRRGRALLGKACKLGHKEACTALK